jgi:hypothetical protein
MATRQCPFCGKIVSDHLTQCPYCRDALPEVRVASPPRTEGRGRIRQGLLYMLLAAVIYYFAGGHSAMELPYPIQPVVSAILSPLLFLSGFGLSLHGFYLHRKP